MGLNYNQFKYRKLFLYAAGAFIITLGTYLLISRFALFGILDRTYTRQQSIDNFRLYEREIAELVDYFKTKLPDTNKGVLFGIDNTQSSYHLGIFSSDGNATRDDPNVGGSRLRLHSVKMDSLLLILDWDKETVLELEKRLKSANVVSISSGNPIKITFRVDKLGRLYYLIFKKPLSDSMINMYNATGRDTVYRRNVVIGTR